MSYTRDKNKLRNPGRDKKKTRYGKQQSVALCRESSEAKETKMDHSTIFIFFFFLHVVSRDRILNSQPKVQLHYRFLFIIAIATGPSY